MIRPRLLAIAITLGFSVILSAQTPAPNPHDKPAEKPAEKAEAKPDAAAEKKEEPKKDEAKKEEAKKDSVTEHSITLNGQKIDYTATAGTLPLKDAEGKTTADIFLHRLQPRRASPMPPPAP
jgi:carboxypeptidase C (cathepsin A)